MGGSRLRNLSPIDIATLSYILVEIIIILVFMSGKAGWLYMLFFYLSAAGIVILTLAFPFTPGSYSGRMVRALYPLFLILFFYRALGSQIFIIFESPFDSAVHRLELDVFGVDPAFAMQRIVDLTLNEVMYCAYLAVYILLPITVILYLLARKWESLERMILSIAIAYYASFLMYIIFPVTGPGYHLEDIYYLPMFGPWFTPLVKNIVDTVGQYGASMPSTQSAVALALAWRIARDFPRTVVPVFFAAALIAASTVYCRFHYLTEAVAGIIIGILSVAVSNLWFDRFLIEKEREELTAGNP